MYDCIVNRTNSVKELEAFAENAVAVNRMILRHMSISEAYAPPVFNLSNAFVDDDIDEKTPRFGIGNDTAACFMIGEPDAGSSADSSNDGGGILIRPGGGRGDHLLYAQASSESDGEQASLGMWMGLSPPGKSTLARRRILSRGSSDDNDSDQVLKIRASRSPPKTASARF